MYPQVFCCPYCSFLSPEPDQVRAHAFSQHAVQPKYRCPLCQEQLVGRPALHFHLSHLHNVVPECVEKLLLVVSNGWLLGSGEGLLKERQGCPEKGTLKSDPTHSISRALNPCLRCLQILPLCGAQMPFPVTWQVCCPSSYLFPVLCWTQALAQEQGALGHPPVGTEWAQAALWS